jgi:hypothetical protein
MTVANDKPSASPSAPAVKAVKWEEVFRAEAAELKERRGAGQDAEKRVGLALSGGGIRSATFCLGFLQGLAEFGLLKKFDYLSTVSGGGYIGSWLATWIKRNGDVERVEQALCPPAATTTCAVPGQHAESREIFHLREYSNYLAPRPSLFSADGWTLIAIYLRNLLINNLVFLQASLALIFLGMLVNGLCAALAYGPITAELIEGAKHSSGGSSVLSKSHQDNVQKYLITPQQPVRQGLECCEKMIQGNEPGRAIDDGRATPKPDDRRGSLITALLVITLLSLTIGCFNVHVRLAQIRPYDLAFGTSSPVLPPPYPMSKVHGHILIPLSIASLAASAAALFWFAAEANRPEWGFTSYFWLFVGFGALFHNLFDLKSLRDLVTFRRGTKPIRYLRARLLAGASGGLLAYGGVVLIFMAQGTVLFVPLAATFLPPLVLLAFVVTSFLQVGFLGKYLGNAAREWWSTLAAWLMLYSVGWLALMAVINFGPALFLEIPSQSLKFATAGTWLLSVWSGLAAAKNSSSGSPTSATKQPDSWFDLLARLGPPLFLLGWILIVVYLANGLFHDSFATDALDYWTRINSPQFLMQADSISAPFVLNWLLPHLPRYLLKPLLAVFFCGLFILLAYLLGRWAGVNVFSLQAMYANRLARCYLGASRERQPEPLTGFDPCDDLPLDTFRMKPSPVAIPEGADATVKARCEDLEKPYTGPLLIVNTAINLVAGTELAWQERKSASFPLTPRHCGSAETDFRDAKEFAGRLTMAAAVSISGAAVSPNMGYHSSPSVTALLTLFNARLGAWVGNPCKPTYKDAEPRSGLLYLLGESLGRTDSCGNYVYLSDGGHFDNLGVYELIRRRCKLIIVCDAGADPDFRFEDLGALLRKSYVDFGVPIEIDVAELRPQADTGRSQRHVALGKIFYGGAKAVADPRERRRRIWSRCDEDEGLLVYVKPSLTGDEPTDVFNYSLRHVDFPHQSTVNQFYSESQFESYRGLGYHCARAAFLGRSPLSPQERTHRYFGDKQLDKLLELLRTTWAPMSPDFLPAFIKSNDDYISIEQALRTDPNLKYFCMEIHEEEFRDHQDELAKPERSAVSVRIAERHMILQMLAVLEKVWHALDVEEYQDHPGFRCWDSILGRWAKTPTFRNAWPIVRKDFGAEFAEYMEKVVGGNGQA